MTSRVSSKNKEKIVLKKKRSNRKKKRNGTKKQKTASSGVEPGLYYASRQQRRGLCRQKGAKIIGKVIDLNRLQKLLDDENGSCGSLLLFTRLG